MMLLPPPKDSCPVCARKHDPHLPHDATTMYHQYRFYGIRGRWPSWADAAAHCAPDVIEAWKQAMAMQGVKWTEPEDSSEPIADPPDESINQPVGDVSSRTFGPEDES